MYMLKHSINSINTRIFICFNVRMLYKIEFWIRLVTTVWKSWIYSCIILSVYRDCFCCRSGNVSENFRTISYPHRHIVCIVDDEVLRKAFCHNGIKPTQIWSEVSIHCKGSLMYPLNFSCCYIVLSMSLSYIAVCAYSYTCAESEWQMFSSFIRSWLNAEMYFLNDVYLYVQRIKPQCQQRVADLGGKKFAGY